MNYTERTNELFKYFKDDMNYESPINIILGEMTVHREDNILKVVQKEFIDVNKEELAKALAYDRGQYKKGYEDGIRASKWIPCSERLPDLTIGNRFSDDVLVTIEWDNGETISAISRYNKNGFWDSDGLDRKVIAWQPLLEPYKGE